MDEQTSEYTVPGDRTFRCSLGPRALVAIHAGVFKTTYRGRPFLKSPMDIALYLCLLDRLNPQTIIEIGTNRGGSALWFADMLTARGAKSRIISIDRKPPADLSDPRISLIAADATALDTVLPPKLLATLPRPWLISEDSAHTYPVCLAVLNFFDKHLQPGDYIVIEDGIVGALPTRRPPHNAPNRAVAEFLTSHQDRYAIDTDLCDQFGYNVTYNPNAWLRRTA